MKFSTFILALLSLSIIISCSPDPCYTKEQFLDTYNEFVKEVENKKEDISDEEQLAYEKRFESIVESCYKKYRSSLTLKERQDFWKSAVKYYIAKEGEDLTLSISTKDDPFQEYVKEEIKDVIKDSSTTILGKLENMLSDSLPNVIDKLVEGFEEFGEDLKDVLEEKK
ncbi:MAG: hypothetical protein HKO66_01050 [Saprospiraceae bacterium]|nr:hypothetical protein [Bacteroidia bacterium]NNE13692.1 hypothetical protein [Saprospiraceae bacterium]NNL90795.1 hypothetical protein [Saprospiraceae bacterium]